MTPLILVCFATIAGALSTTPTAMSATEQSEMTSAASLWQTNLTHNISALADSSLIDAYIYPLTTLSTTLVSPLTDQVVSTAESDLSIAVAPNATIVTSMNETTDITQAVIGSVNFTFNSVTPSQFTFTADDLGSEYASYTQTGKNYTLFVQ